MGVTKRPDGKWRARVLGPDGRERSKHFSTKTLAQRWEREQLAARDRGQFVDPADRTTVADYASQWAAGRPHRVTTARRVRSMVKLHIAATPLGDRRLVAVRPSEVQAWATDRAKVMAPSTLRILVGLLSSIFTSAVLDRLISTSPVVRIKLPDNRSERIAPLTIDQVHALADAVPARNRAMIITQAGLGLRLGELTALRVQDVDFLRRKVRVEFQRDRETLQLLPPKTNRSRRTIPLPQVVADALAVHRSEFAPGPDGCIFTSSTGRPYRHAYIQTFIFHRSVKAAGLPSGTTSHDLRHHFASVLLSNSQDLWIKIF